MARSSRTWARVSMRRQIDGGSPQSFRFRTKRECRARLLSAASLPPLRTRQLPDLRASAPIWVRASGRDSKMAISTPMGRESRVSVRLSSSRVFFKTWPTGSGRAATCSTCRAICSILPGESARRLSRGAARPVDSAFARSRALASRSSALFSRSRLAYAHKNRFLASVSRLAGRDDASLVSWIRFRSSIPDTRALRKPNPAIFICPIFEAFPRHRPCRAGFLTL